MIENQSVTSEPEGRSSAAFKLSGWRVEPRDLRLTGHGHTRDLEPRIMAVLLALARTPGRVVTKEALVADAWAGQPVSDNAITWAVSRLRKALEPESGLIRTVTGQGYRLEAEVHPVGPASRRHRFLWLAGLAGVVGILLAVFWLSRVHPGAAPSRSLSPDALFRLTTLPGRETEPAISADGRWLAFAHREGPHASWRLQVAPVREDRLLPVTGGDGRPTGERRASTRPPVPVVLEQPNGDNRRPAWSPDGGQLAYLNVTEGRCQARLMALGADRQSVVNDQALFACPATTRSRLVWTADQRLLVALEEGGRYRLQSYDPRRGEWTAISDPGGSGPGDRVFTLGADGRSGVLARHGADSSTTLYAFSIDGGVTERIGQTPYWFYNLALTDTGDLVFNRSDHELVRYDRGADTWHTLLSGSDRIWHAAFTRDGRLYFESLVPAKSSVLRMGDDADDTVLIRSARSDSNAVMAPDGTLAWVSDRSGIPQIWLREPDGMDQQLTDARAPRAFSALAFSPDGRRLLAVADGQVGSIDRATETFSVHSPEGEWASAASWTPEGTHVLYSRRTDEGWDWMSVAVDAPPDAARLLRRGVRSGRWLEDGSRLTARDDADGLWLEPVDGEVRRVVEGEIPDHWWVEARVVHLVRASAVEAIDLDGGVPVVVLRLSPLDAPAVAPANRPGIFLVTRYQQPESDIVLQRGDPR